MEQPTLPQYATKELLHTAIAIGITVLVAVAATLADVGSFQEVSLTGIAITAIRSAATAIVTLGSRFIIK